MNFARSNQCTALARWCGSSSKLRTSALSVASRSRSNCLKNCRRTYGTTRPVSSAGRADALGAPRETSELPTKLEQIIRESIMTTGPISMATYMQMCLSHPTHGYYMNPDNAILGTRGDFITSPEISQVFGELLGIWHLTRWEAAGRPPRIKIVELGPGRGTLMADMLRAMSQIRACTGAIKSVHLVETSAAMREHQRSLLTPAGKSLSWKYFWWDTVEDVIDHTKGDEYTMLVAHEFFDALPVHLLEKTAQGWHELRIGCTTEPTLKGMLEPKTDCLRLVREPHPSSQSTVLGASSRRFASLPIGARIEVSPTSYKIARQITRLLGSSRSLGGSGLIIDYGNDHVHGNSLRLMIIFQAFREHKIVDIFSRPGQSDLTANVDFAYVKEAMADGVTTHGPISQSAFLEGMGITVRVNSLMRNAKTEDRRTEIARAARRLVDSSGMGREYKVLGVTADPLQKHNGKAGDSAEQIWPFAQ
ncbi:DUF185-domain-containing protein [Rickenella mellea]|uniref:Protein arginine methyltransferase NDUFAF7 n=1 Tax=Rickenella mellea TaxID=50990 RepID=A0A4Y7PMP5_9AGAM|nr:DUF185-domain-containing protein [Rickenella mellea]